jgi:hypothetical protein
LSIRISKFDLRRNSRQEEKDIREDGFTLPSIAGIKSNMKSSKDTDYLQEIYIDLFY